MHVVAHGMVLEGGAFNFGEFLDRTPSPLVLSFWDPDEGKALRVTREREAPPDSESATRLFHGELDERVVAGAVVRRRKGERETVITEVEEGVWEVRAHAVAEGACDMSLFLYDRAERFLIYQHLARGSVGPRSFLNTLRGHYQRERQDAATNGEFRGDPSLREPLRYRPVTRAGALDEIFREIGNGTITLYHGTELSDSSPTEAAPGLSLKVRTTTVKVTVTRDSPAESRVAAIRNCIRDAKRAVFRGRRQDGTRFPRGVDLIERLDAAAELDRLDSHEWMRDAGAIRLGRDFPKGQDGKTPLHFQRLRTLLERETAHLRLEKVARTDG